MIHLLCEIVGHSDGLLDRASLIVLANVIQVGITAVREREVGGHLGVNRHVLHPSVQPVLQRLGGCTNVPVTIGRGGLFVSGSEILCTIISLMNEAINYRHSSDPMICMHDSHAAWDNDALL